LEGLIWRLSTEDEMDETIEKFADLIKQKKMETAAILVLESIKPLAPLGGPLSRIFVSPMLHMMGVNTRHFINTFEDPKNIERLLQLLEADDK